MAYQLTFSRVVVIESLDPGEARTGLQFSQYVDGLLVEAGKTIPVDFFVCESFGEFVEIMQGLARISDLSDIPLVHIECHGDIADGLIFSNGSNATWDQVANLIRPINLATGFNLTISMYACHAAAFLGEMGGLKPCPARMLVAPTEEVNPAECMQGFMTFYRSLIQGLNVMDASSALKEKRLESGLWIVELAESWFLRLTRDYLRNFASKNGMEKRAKNMRRRLRVQKISVTNKKVLAHLRDFERREIFRTFRFFFALEDHPENAEKFKEISELVESGISKLRSQGVLGF